MNYGWDWNKFKGSKRGLEFNARDLPNLDAVMKMLPRKQVAVQGGGNLGIFPKRMAQEFKSVYSFEPDPECFSIMVSNAPEENIIRFQAALGFNRVGVNISRSRRDGKPPTHEGTRHVKGEGAIPTLRIDDLELKVCDLVYLDLEGFELYALHGARQTIQRCRPLVAVEINKSLDFMELKEEDVITFIRMQNYTHHTKLASDHIFVPAEWQR